MKKYILYGMISFLGLTSNVYALSSDIVIGIINSFLAFLLNSLPIAIIILVPIFIYINRAKERKKSNVEDRNHTNAHGKLDKTNKSDKAFIDYVEGIEDKVDILLVDFFNNITNMEYIKSHCSEELASNIEKFINDYKSKDQHLVVKDCLVHRNEINKKFGDVFTSDIIIECYNYMEDKKGTYLFGYKGKKEFVRKRISFSIRNEDILMINIEEL